MRTADTIAAQESSTGNSEKISEGKKRSLANLKPWKPGQSGNPSGRPKNDVAREIAQAIFEENREALYEAFGKAALSGNAYTFKELAERAFGKVPDKVEMSGPDGGPISYEQARLATLTTEELKALESIAAKLAAPVRDTGGTPPPGAEQDR
jgi:hypothetical protein